MADVGSSNSNPRWVDTALDRNRRSIRITDESWEKFKPILCTLYKSYTLNIVMEFMEKRFNFRATKRQYGYRFEKWRVKKYNSGDKKTSMESLEHIEFDDHRTFSTSPRLSVPGSITSTSAIADDVDHDDYMTEKPSSRHHICYPWGPGDGNEARKLAADFCAAMLDDENAFSLYSELYSSLSSSGKPHSATHMFVAVSCARVADRPDNARQAHGLLSNLLAQRQAHNAEPHFVLSMLKAYMEDHLEEADKTVVKHRTCNTVRRFLESNGSLKHLPHSYSSIDLVAYHFLSHGLDQFEQALCEAETPPNFSSEHLLNEFIRRQPFIDKVRQNLSPPLRLCVAWCSQQLRLDHPVPLQSPLIQPSPDMRYWWDNIRIFCTLWGVMQGLVRADAAPEWYSQCESAYGISASELLVTVSWMIGAETIPSDHGVSDKDLLRNAAKCAHGLSELKESELLCKFLAKFEWMNEIVDLGDDERSFEALLQSQLRQYLSETLRIKLPYPAQSHDSAAVSDMNGFGAFDYSDDFDFVSLDCSASMAMTSELGYGALSTR
ncbi:hypothetical protein ACHAPT_008482 [Fusarium lateritium]